MRYSYFAQGVRPLNRFIFCLSKEYLFIHFIQIVSRFSSQLSSHTLMFPDEIDLTLDRHSRGILKMTLKGFEMTYDTKTGVFEFMGEKLIPSVNKSDIRIRIYVDRTSIEIFLNDGEYYIGKAILPQAGVKPMELQTKSGKLIFSQLKVFELKSIW